MNRPGFHLTRRAAGDLRDIYAHSREHWGEKTARGYIDKLYDAMGGLTASDNRTRQREKRSIPFHMIPAGKHFLVYEIIGDTPVIIAILHQRSDIESIIRDFTPNFLSEVASLRKALKESP